MLRNVTFEVDGGPSVLLEAAGRSRDNRWLRQGRTQDPVTGGLQGMGSSIEEEFVGCNTDGRVIEEVQPVGTDFGGMRGDLDRDLPGLGTTGIVDYCSEGVYQGRQDGGLQIHVGFR